MRNRPLHQVMRIITPIFYCLAICLCISHSAFGNKESKGKLKDAEFIIEKDLTHALEEASRKFDSAPASPRVTVPDKPLVFAPPALSPIFDTLSPKVKLLRAKRDTALQPYGNYLRVGHGNAYAPYVEGFLSNSVHETYTYGLHLKHLSHGKQRWGEATHHLLRLYGKRFEERFWLGGDVSYHRDRHPFYEHNSAISSGEKKQYVDYFDLQGDWGNHYGTAFNFQVSPAFHDLSLQGNSERKITLRGRGDYVWTDDLLVQSAVDLHFTQCNGAQLNLYRFKFLRPFTSYSLGDHRLDVQWGFNAAYQEDSQRNAASNPINVTPVAKIKYPLYTWLKTYVGFEGDIQPNSLKSFVQENPWLAPETVLRHTNQPFLLYGGFEGELIKRIRFSQGGSVGYYQDFPLWVNIFEQPHYFEIKYDRGVTLCNVFCDLSYTNRAETWITHLRGDRFFYSLSDERQPWHRPGYQLSLLSTYKWHDKVALKGEFCWIEGVKVWENFQEKELGSLVNAQVSIDYCWNSRVATFFQAKYPFAAAYERYLNHPEHGPQLMLGMSYIW